MPGEDILPEVGESHLDAAQEVGAPRPGDCAPRHDGLRRGDPERGAFSAGCKGCVGADGEVVLSRVVDARAPAAEHGVRAALVRPQRTLPEGLRRLLGQRPRALAGTSFTARA